MAKTPIFTGAATAIVTPFTENSIDFDAFENIIEFQIKNSIDAIVVCGTTGEASTMHDEEHLSAIKFVVDKVAGRVPVIAGTGSNYTSHCIELSQEAEKLGADALLVVTPYYNKTTQTGLIKHYEAVADSVNLPIVVYNVPSRTGLNMSASTLKALSAHKNINAIKEASGDITLVAKMVALCGDDIVMYSGNDDMTVPVMSVGGKGIISVVSNILPKDVHDMAQKYLDGDIEESRKLQLKLMEIIGAAFVEVNPIPIKTAMNLLGFNAGKLRLPLCDMSSANLEVLKKAMTNYGLNF